MTRPPKDHRSLPASFYRLPLFRTSSPIVQCTRACVGVDGQSTPDTALSLAGATCPTAEIYRQIYIYYEIVHEVQKSKIINEKKTLRN